MKKMLLIACCYIFIYTACTTSKTSFQPLINATFNQELIDNSGRKKLIGLSNREGLLQEPYKEWFERSYKAYRPSAKKLDLNKKLYKNVDIQIFMGTWCGDSRREVPRFYKVLDQLNWDESRIQLINVDNTSEQYKQSPDGEEKGLNIHRVPTFIFLRDGEEIGRIVESPVNTLETDLAQILLGVPSRPQYRVVTFLHHKLLTEGAAAVTSQLEQLARPIPYFVKGASELNTYGYVLLGQKKWEEAIVAFRLNCLVFPEDANTYDSLGEAYYKAGNQEEAEKNYRKVLELDPGNLNALAMLEKLGEK